MLIREVTATDSSSYFELWVQSDQEFQQFVDFNVERELAAGQSGIDDTRELRVLPLGLPSLNRSVVKEMAAYEFRKNNSYSSYVR